MAVDLMKLQKEIEKEKFSGEIRIVCNQGGIRNYKLYKDVTKK